MFRIATEKVISGYYELEVTMIKNWNVLLKGRLVSGCFLSCPHSSFILCLFVDFYFSSASPIVFLFLADIFVSAESESGSLQNPSLGGA